MTDPPEPFISTPAPVRARHDGWTVARQRIFIAALRELRSIARAARVTGMSREGAYALRRHAGAEDFAAAWDAALAGPGTSRTPGPVRRRPFSSGTRAAPNFT